MKFVIYNHRQMTNHFEIALSNERYRLNLIEGLSVNKGSPCMVVAILFFLAYDFPEYKEICKAKIEGVLKERFEDLTVEELALINDNLSSMMQGNWVLQTEIKAKKVVS